MVWCLVFVLFVDMLIIVVFCVVEVCGFFFGEVVVVVGFVGVGVLGDIGVVFFVVGGLFGCDGVVGDVFVDVLLLVVYVFVYFVDVWVVGYGCGLCYGVGGGEGVGGEQGDQVVVNGGVKCYGDFFRCVDG